MGRRTAGVCFCFIAAFLYSARYITAAIFGSGVSSWNAELFDAMLQYVGNSLTTLSIVALAVGIVYLVLAEIGKYLYNFISPALCIQIVNSSFLLIDAL